MQLTSTSYSSGAFKYKLVGEELYVWLGQGYGTLDHQGAVLNGPVQESGSVNASGNGGARTGTLSIKAKKGQVLAIEAEIYQGGYEHCTKFFNPSAR